MPMDRAVSSVLTALSYAPREPGRNYGCNCSIMACA